jgi:hypothetical protein
MRGLVLDWIRLNCKKWGKKSNEKWKGNDEKGKLQGQSKRSEWCDQTVASAGSWWLAEAIVVVRSGQEKASSSLNEDDDPAAKDSEVVEKGVPWIVAR